MTIAPTHAVTLGSTSRNPAAPLLPWLVLPNLYDPPAWPFDVANTEGSTVAVLCTFVTAVVEKVAVVEPSDSLTAPSVRNTRATPGAGTWTEHVFAVWSQLIVLTSSVPVRRPSEERTVPNDCSEEVKSEINVTSLYKAQADLAGPSVAADISYRGGIEVSTNAKENCLALYTQD